jgi:hypothetical protein
MTEQPQERSHKNLDIRCSDAVELVTEYLEKALDADDLARFEAHIADCDGCSVFVDQIKMTIRLTNQSTDEQVEVMPANFDELVDMLRRRT